MADDVAETETPYAFSGAQGRPRVGPIPPTIDPVVTALVARLPPAGAVWAKADQDLWIGALLAAFRVIYPDKPSEGPQT